MPRIIATDAQHAIVLPDLVDALEEMRLESGDEDSLAEAAPALRALSNHRTFLGEIALAELKTHCKRQLSSNRYTGQVMLLHRSARGYFIRANFWPSEQDSIYKRTGPAHFFYGMPHDHNFHFLTVGYSGPGYWSDYYEHDGESLHGYCGEPIKLRFIERSALSEGKVMLYRAHRDIHNQLPADRFSVSINIMQQTDDLAWRNQVILDLERGTVASVPTYSQTEAMLKIAAHFGGGNGRDLAEDFMLRHPVERVRLSAAEALASAQDSIEDALLVWESLAHSPSAMLRETAGNRLDLLAI
jgi:hypothetical protein